MCAFFVVALGVLILRQRDPERRRTFRAPLLWVVGPLAIFGRLFLFSQLSAYTELLFVGWTLVGHSRLCRLRVSSQQPRPLYSEEPHDVAPRP